MAPILVVDPTAQPACPTAVRPGEVPALSWTLLDVYGPRVHRLTKRARAWLFQVGLIVALATPGHTQTNESGTATTPALPRSVSLLQSANLALLYNRTLLQARQDLEVAHGIAMETRAILLPKLKSTGSYQPYNLQEFGNSGGSRSSTIAAELPIPDRLWYGNVRVVQSIYEGGRMLGARRSAKLTTQRAVDQYRVTMAEVLRDVRLAYYNVLLAASQQNVLADTLQWLEKQTAETRQKLAAGTSVNLDVARAEAETARTRARSVMATNQLHLAKTRLLVLLGFKLPEDPTQEITVELSDSFLQPPTKVELGAAVRQALADRPEIKVLECTLKLNGEEVRTASAGRLPSVQIFGGYGGLNDMLNRDLQGWFAGAQMDWDIFDGLAARGKARRARAVQERNRIGLEDLKEQVELEVRTAFSELSATREVVESLRKAGAQAEEALRLTRLRLKTGTATDLDAMAAQVALMEIQASAVEALYRFNTAVTQMEFATAANLPAE